MATLEEQLQTLSDLGLPLADGVTIDDLLHSYSRSEYEDEPYGFALAVMGEEIDREPWDRYVCNRAWHFDTECVYSTGDYAAIVKRLCQLSGDQSYLTNIRDLVDLEREEAWLEYTVGGATKHWPLEFNGDWADMLSLSHVMEDLERDGYRFYAMDNGQAAILFYLKADAAERINELSGGAPLAVCVRRS